MQRNRFPFRRKRCLFEDLESLWALSISIRVVALFLQQRLLFTWCWLVVFTSLETGGTS